MQAPAPCDALAEIEAALARGDREAARAVLRRMIETSFAPDAMAATVDRLVTLVREQEAQIAALRALVESRL